MQNTLPKTTTQAKFKHRDWHITPHATQPNRFDLGKTKTGEILGTIILPEDGDPELLNLIAAAPELHDIAEMYRDHMKGNPMERTMVFSLVEQVLERTEQPHEVVELECA